MTARQVLNVAYASLTEGADQEQRGKFDAILEGNTEKTVKADNRKAMQTLAGMGIRTGQVR